MNKDNSKITEKKVTQNKVNPKIEKIDKLEKRALFQSVVKELPELGKSKNPFSEKNIDTQKDDSTKK